MESMKQVAKDRVAVALEFSGSVVLVDQDEFEAIRHAAVQLERSGLLSIAGADEAQLGQLLAAIHAHDDLADGDEDRWYEDHMARHLAKAELGDVLFSIPRIRAPLEQEWAYRFG